MAKSLTSDLIKLKNVRGSFLRLDQPKAFQPGQEPRFEATFLLDPSKPDHKAMIDNIKAEAVKLIKEKWGEKPAGLKLCFGNADDDPMKAKYDGYKGMFYIVTANTQRPIVVGRQKQAVVAGDKEFPFSGCYVDTVPTLWTQDNKFGKAIRGNLRLVRFVSEGAAFGGGGSANADTELDALEDGPGVKASTDFDL